MGVHARFSRTASCPAPHKHEDTTGHAILKVDQSTAFLRKALLISRTDSTRWLGARMVPAQMGCAHRPKVSLFQRVTVVPRAKPRRLLPVQPRPQSSSLQTFTFDCPSTLRILEAIPGKSARARDARSARSDEPARARDRLCTPAAYTDNEVGRIEITCNPEQNRELVDTHEMVMEAYKDLYSTRALTLQEIRKALRATSLRDTNMFDSGKLVRGRCSRTNENNCQWIFDGTMLQSHTLDLLGHMEVGEREGLIEFLQFSRSPLFLLASYARRKVLFAGYMARGGRFVQGAHPRKRSNSQEPPGKDSSLVDNVVLWEYDFSLAGTSRDMQERVRQQERVMWKKQLNDHTFQKGSLAHLDLEAWHYPFAYIRGRQFGTSFDSMTEHAEPLIDSRPPHEAADTVQVALRLTTPSPPLVPGVDVDGFGKHEHDQHHVGEQQRHDEGAGSDQERKGESKRYNESSMVRRQREETPRTSDERKRREEESRTLAEDRLRDLAAKPSALVGCHSREKGQQEADGEQVSDRGKGRLKASLAATRRVPGGMVPYNNSFQGPELDEEEEPCG